MTLNERIKELRNLLGLSQKEFAKTIGISQRSVSWGEQPGNNVPDNTIKNICMTFGVNEDWLRNGTEPMYTQAPTFSLDDFLRQHGATELELQIVKTYFDLAPDTRAMLIDHFKKGLASPPPAAAGKENPDSVPETGGTVPEKTVEELEEEYKKTVLRSARKTDGSSASSTTEERDRTGTNN